MAQTKTIQLLRSQNLYESIQAAKTAMNSTSITSGRKDGEMLLARYNAGTTEQPKIQSLICIWHNATGIQPAGWTFIEDVSNNADSPAALRELINNVITGAGLETGTGAFVRKTDDVIIGSSTSITDAVNDIADYIQTMDLTQVGGTSGDVITTVSQADGKVSANKSSLTDVAMTGYAADPTQTGSIAATDTLEQAFNKVENAIAKNTVSSADKTVKITQPTTGDSAGKTDLSVNIDGTTLVKDNSTGVISSALKVIKVVPEGTAGTDEVVDANLGTNIQEAYRLVYGNSTTAIGKQINIYKDSALKEVYLGTQSDTVNPSTGQVTKQQSDDPQSLNFVYHLTDNTYSITKVDVSKFLSESEFSDGLQVTNHVVSVKIDSSSEKDSQDTPADFLTVGSGGIKVSGIKDEIDRKIAALDVTDTAVAGQYVSAVNETDGKVAMTRANVSEAVLNNYSKSQTAPSVLEIAATDTINQAFNKLEHKIADGVDALDGAATATAPAANGDFSVLTKVNEINGVVQSVGTEDDNSKEVLLKKVAATGAAEDVTIADSGNLITATNVESALQEIATNVKNNHIVNNDVITVATDTTNQNTKLTVTTGNGLEKTGTNNNTLAVKQGNGVTVNANGVSVNAGDGLVIDNSGNVNVNTGDGLEIASDAVKIKLDTTTSNANITSDMLSISANGLMMKDTWDCGTF